ncbi:MAG: LysM peptidoglycan-binding domain-containing protein, partial [Bacteroidetes bacterium]|nr:LysM peptidoglycan-binding domain-containing protein [Bacteroidota bacterium]
FEKVTVDDCIDLSILAECAETDLETIRDLNPELLQWCTPPNYKGYQLRIPVGKSAIFAENYLKIPEERKLDFAIHTIRRGETVSKIASQYKVTTAILMEVNKLPKNKRLKVGATLVIPVRSGSATAIVEAQRKKEIADQQRYNRIKEEGRKVAAARASVAGSVTVRKKPRTEQATYEPAGREKLVYTVKAGETIGHIAEWFNVRASHIRNWNNIPYGKHIFVGQRLAIWVPEEKVEQYKALASRSFKEKQQARSTSAKKRSASQRESKATLGWMQHKVKKGETLEKIAEKYDVAIADLKAWNKLKTSRINAGAVLEVFAPDQADESADEVVVTKKPVAKNPKKSVTHVVRKGDTLETIAERYNVSIADLKKWNDLRTSRIMVGQKLKVQS